MRTFLLFIGALALTSSATAQAQSNAKPQPPLIEGGALECPDHLGLRQFHSETAAYKRISVSIWADSRRDAKGCQQTANLHVVKDGATHDYTLPDAEKQSFTIVDFSPDGASLFLSTESDVGGFRDVQLGRFVFSSETLRWENAWDIFGWRDCDATVEPEGFAADGNIIVSASPSVQDLHELKNCVADQGVYDISLAPPAVKQMPNGLKVSGHGAITEGTWRTCENDPDVVAACFIVHGRLSFWNGGPSARIWRIGTKRILGVHDDVLPGTLGLNMNDFDDAAFGDFYVCPFTREKPGAMQFVCIESVKHVTHRKRD